MVNHFNNCMQVVEKVDLHYEDKRLYHIKNDPMKIIVHYDTSIDRYTFSYNNSC